MGKKLKLPFLSQSKSLENPKKLEHTTSLPSQWPFPSCGNIKTLSFRADDNAFRTFNSAFLDNEMTASTESFFTVSSSSRTFSTMSEDLGDPFETVIHGLKSDRLFFEPEQSCSLMSLEKQQEQDRGRPGTSAVLDQEKGVDTEETEVVYKESEALSLESINPYEDFKRSMMEMVEAHDLNDWQGLEELLGCYLKINGKNNHGYIMGAFIDLLVSLSFDTKTTNSTTNTITNTSTSSSTTTTSSSSTTSSSLLSTNLINCSSSPCSPLSLPSSSLTTPCLSSLFDHDDHNDNHDDDTNDGDNDEQDDR